MFDTPLGLMRSLQHSDSFFPSGATAFSWGLESLCREQIITDASSLSHHIETQLLHRWKSFDQGLICAAWQTTRNINKTLEKTIATLFEIDTYADVMTLSESIRTGSRKLGQTLLNVYIKLENKSAIQLHEYLLTNTNYRAPHLAVIQGYLWATFGMSELESKAVSAHSLCVNATSAALRLGVIGHIDAQRILIQMQPHIVDALNLPAPTLTALSSSTLVADIANLRHDSLDARMFVN